MSNTRQTSRAPKPPLEATILRAESLVLEARGLRVAQRKRKLPHRGRDLAAAIARINRHQKKMRRLIAAVNRRPLRDTSLELRLRESSDQLQRERRKLRKMLARTTSRS